MVTSAVVMVKAVPHRRDLRRGVVRLGALAARVAVVQDGERGAD